MHLPFTYATGEALLYQSNHPIAGFRDGSHEKTGGKSKKSRSDRLPRDSLDPSSLLGALMSQDVSVYVSQPAVEPKISFHSSFFDQIDFSVSGACGLHRSWDQPSNGVFSPDIAEPSTSSNFDPLLATLDSLSLEGQGVVDADAGGCSNGELFGALESLGLSAEDLELLLLDERMIRVEMDPEHVPTLDDLLTNDEILSYIYESIEGKPDPADSGQVPPCTSAASASLAESSLTAGSSLQQMPVPLHKLPLVGQAPILQLSQQMQKHLHMQTGKSAHGWDQSEFLAEAIVTGEDPSLSSGQWTTRDVLSGAETQHFDSQAAVFNGKAPELDTELLQRQHYLQQCQAKQKVAALSGQSGVSERSAAKAQWQDCGFGDACLEDGQKPLPDASLDSCVSYSLSEVDGVDYADGGSALFARGGQQHEAAVASFQGPNHKPQQQEKILVPLAQVISSLSQCPPPNASLEHILGVGKSCRPLDHYGVVASEVPQEAIHGKVSWTLHSGGGSAWRRLNSRGLLQMENSCILSGSYPGGCALPNGNGSAPPAVQMHSSETLSSLSDPPTSGFYL